MTDNLLRAASSIEIVDAHHHLWDLGSGHYPWLQDEYHGDNFFLGSYERLRHDYLAEDYRRDTGGYHIVDTVHIEAERSRGEQVEETAWLHDQRARTRLPGVVVAHVSFRQPDLDEVLTAHTQFSRVRGIRSKPVTSNSPYSRVQGDPGTLQDPKWLDGLAQLEAHGLSWDLRVPFWHLSEAAEVAAMFPRIPIVLNHTGLPLDRSDDGLTRWRAGLARLADCPNVYVKLSELGLKGGQWDPVSNQRVLRDAVSIFGTHRAMFASNLPVSGLSANFSQVFESVLNSLSCEDDQAVKDIFANNARMFYRMDSSVDAA